MEDLWLHNLLWPLYKLSSKITAMTKIDFPKAFYRVSVKALIRTNNKLLLVKEYDQWVLPGGGLDHGEDAQRGLERELSEELTVDEIISIKRNPSFVGFTLQGKRDEYKGMQVPMCFICYDVEIEGEIRPGPEAKEVGFFSEKDLEQIQLPDDEKETIFEVSKL